MSGALHNQALTVGLITGSGTYGLPNLAAATPGLVETAFGWVEVTTGRLAGVDIVHVSRHGDGHPRLSHQVTHRANIAALEELGVDCAIAMTICGAVDPTLALGELVVFDDFYFPSNRLPDGSVCTFHLEPGNARRAHWIFEGPYAPALRRALAAAAGEVGQPLREGGCYGHVDGPRFNTAAEVRALRTFGVTAISQTAGPEAVLTGEIGMPHALVGFVTDYANGTGPRHTTVEELMQNMASSAGVFGALIERALPQIVRVLPEATGVNYGFERDRASYTFHPAAAAGNAVAIEDLSLAQESGNILEEG